VDKVEFLIASGDTSTYPRADLPEVAFFGRSNVGKSSLLNTICGDKKLARVSSTPGRTRTVNFYLVNGRCHFVDLPGYGYAHASREERMRWKDNVESYLNQRRLRLAVLLVDARVGPTELDLTMVEWLRSRELPWLPVATKCDKPRPSELRSLLLSHARALATEPQALIAFSARTGAGRERLLESLGRALLAMP
jgi:GTP-binding protein